MEARFVVRSQQVSSFFLKFLSSFWNAGGHIIHALVTSNWYWTHTDPQCYHQSSWTTDACIYNRFLTDFIEWVFFYTLWKQMKTISFLVLSGGTWPVAWNGLTCSLHSWNVSAKDFIFSVELPVLGVLYEFYKRFFEKWRTFQLLFKATIFRG